MRIKGHIDLYEHKVPFDLEFDLHEPSVADCILCSETGPNEAVAAYLSDYTGSNCHVDSYESENLDIELRMRKENEET